MLRQLRTLIIILDRTNYYAIVISVPLTLNYNYLVAPVFYFTVIIYELHTKNQHLISYVWILLTLIVVFSTYPGDAAPVLCMLILVQNFKSVIRKSIIWFLTATG